MLIGKNEIEQSLQLEMNHPGWTVPLQQKTIEEHWNMSSLKNSAPGGKSGGSSRKGKGGSRRSSRGSKKAPPPGAPPSSKKGKGSSRRKAGGVIGSITSSIKSMTSKLKELSHEKQREPKKTARKRNSLPKRKRS